MQEVPPRAGLRRTLGPDLSQIGKKYERATLLETILDPSKAIAPEYVAYLLETTGGQVYAGFLVEKTDKEVTLKDVEGKQIRVPPRRSPSFEPQKKSLMPELVLRDVTAQDAADLLAFLTSLTSARRRRGSKATRTFSCVARRRHSLPRAPLEEM